MSSWRARALRLAKAAQTLAVFRRHSVHYLRLRRWQKELRMVCVAGTGGGGVQGRTGGGGDEDGQHRAKNNIL